MNSPNKDRTNCLLDVRFLGGRKFDFSLTLRTIIPSEIIAHSRLATLIEFVDHLPVNKLGASGLS